MIDVDKLPEVTSPEIYDKNNNFHPDGIMSEVIFGPVRDYKCTCGYYSIKTIYQGKRCPRCNVLCDSKMLRYLTFAKISLVLPVIDHRGKSSIKKIVENNPSIIDPIQADLSRSMEHYLVLDENKDSLFLSSSRIDDGDFYTAKIPVTGIYSLYLALLDIQNKTGSVKSSVLLGKFTRYVIVTPPMTRVDLEIRQEDKRQPLEVRHDLNEAYTKIIRLNNYINKEFVETNIINRIETAVISDSLTEDLINIVRVHLDLLCAKLQYFYNNIHSIILQTISGKPGKIRSSFLRKSIDFSSRAVVVPGPHLKAYEVEIPRKTLLRFYIIEFIKYLIQEKAYDYLTQIRRILEDTEFLFRDFVEHFDDFISRILSDEVPDTEKVILINRQPTLWRYGITGVKIAGISDGDVIRVSPLIMEQMNADCDGDTMAMYRFHDEDARNQIIEKNYNLTNLFYDPNSEPLHRIRLEALYMFNIMTSAPLNPKLNEIIIENLSDLEIKYNIDFGTPVFIKRINRRVTYGIALVNKFCNFNTIIIDKKISSSEVSKIIYQNSVNKEDYHNRLSNLNRSLLWFVSVADNETLTIPIEVDLIHSESNKKYLDFLKLLPNNPFIGYILQQSLTDKIIENLSDDSKTFKLMGTKLSKTQLARCTLLVGYIANDKNKIINKPIFGSYFSGINEDDFFEMCYGSRKGIVDKSDFTPRSGYFERTSVMNLSFIEIAEENCQTPYYYQITILSDNHAKSLYNRFYYDPETNSEKLFTKDTKYEIGQSFLFRSPITCRTPDFKICRRCFGLYDLPSNRVGIMAGQYVSERFTQLILRTFHTSGSCSISVSKQILGFFKDNIEDIVREADGIKIFFKVNIPNETIDYLKDLPGFVKVENNFVEFLDLKDDELYDNQDIVTTVKSFIKELYSGGSLDIDYVYKTLIQQFLDISVIYSSFLEVFLCNMFLDKNDRPIRYSDNFEIKKRKSIKNLHTILGDSLLGFLYEPNEASITGIRDLKRIAEPPEKIHSIYEELWYKY